jgi:3-dehydroquinate dehydratase
MAPGLSRQTRRLSWLSLSAPAVVAGLGPAGTVLVVVVVAQVYPF